MLLTKINPLASLAFAATVAAVGDVKMFTDNIDLLNSIGMKDFLDGWDEVGLVINGVTFHETPNELNQPNTTSTNVQTRGLTFAPRARGSTLAARAPTSGCYAPQCAVNPVSHLFSPAQEKFLTGKMCPLVAKYGPGLGFAMIGLYTSQAFCQSGSCTVVLTAAFTIAEKATGLSEALQAACQLSYDSISSSCGDFGGSDTCAIVNEASNDVKYSVTTAPSGTICPAGTTQCSAVACNSANDNCQDY